MVTTRKLAQTPPLVTAPPPLTEQGYHQQADMAANRAKADALSAMPWIAGGMMGVGGLKALWDARKRRQAADRVMDIDAGTSPSLPFLATNKMALDMAHAAPALPSAATPADSSASSLASWLQPIYNNLLHKTPGSAPRSGGFLAGDYATSARGKWDVPWMPIAGLGLGYGGYRLGHGLVNSATKSQLSGDVEDEAKKTRNEYVQALQAGLPVKSAAFAKASQDFHPPTLSWDNLGPAAGLATGAYGTLTLANFLQGMRQKKLDLAKRKAQPGMSDVESTLGVAPPSAVSYT